MKKSAENISSALFNILISSKVLTDMVIEDNRQQSA